MTGQLQVQTMEMPIGMKLGQAPMGEDIPQLKLRDQARGALISTSDRVLRYGVDIVDQTALKINPLVGEALEGIGIPSAPVFEKMYDQKLGIINDQKLLMVTLIGLCVIGAGLIAINEVRKQLDILRNIGVGF